MYHIEKKTKHTVLCHCMSNQITLAAPRLGAEEGIRKASALLTSVRWTSFHSPELLSVRQAWSDMDHNSWLEQQKAAPTLDLVTALRRAHDETQAPVLWPTPQEAQEELHGTKKRCGDSRDQRGYRRGD